MQLTTKLLSSINRVFEKDPERFLALRLRHSAPMNWDIADAVLRTFVADLPQNNLSVDLRQYTLSSLATFLAAQPGYQVILPPDPLPPVSATTLIDGEGDINESNGDHLYAYSSLLWSYMEANAVELTTARAQIVEAIEQLSTRTADAEWLDELGSYYAVERRPGELDAQYGPRIIATVLMPRGNNIAIAAAIEQVSNGLRARIVDSVDTPVINRFRNGSILFNGAFPHASGEGIYAHNLFDALFDVDFSSPIAFDAARIAAIINDFRDAGNHLRRMSLSGSMQDAVDSGSWQDFVTIAGSLTARGAGATATAIAPNASASAGVVISAPGAAASTLAPSATAGEPSPGVAEGLGTVSTVAAPNAQISAGARPSAAGPGVATVSAPSATVSVVPTEILNIAIEPFSETYVSAVARRHNGDLTRNGAEVYDSGDETFEITITGA